MENKDLAPPAEEAKPLASGTTDEVETKSGPVARVVLPTAEDEDSDNDEADGEEAGTEEDYLADFPDDTPELELVHCRIGSLEPLRLARFAAHLQKLCLRQNHISKLDEEVFRTLTQIEELDFYDNKLKNVDGALSNMKALSVLDLSFNLLRAIPADAKQLPRLKTMYFVQNKISKINGLEGCTSLTSLELGGNRIRVIEHLDELVNLEELWLGKNKISKLENLSALKKLRILSLQSNRITQLEGLENLTELEELYISHNGLKRLEGLDNNVRLKTLDVGNNFIPEIENISHLSDLEELWMNGNKIPDLHSLEPQLAHLKSLETLYLEANPCQKNDMSGYRRKIHLALPQLSQIDATYIRA